MFRKALIALTLLCLCVAAFAAAEDIPYFSDIAGELPVSEDRSVEDTVLQTYADVRTEDCAAFSVALLESGFMLTEKALTDEGAVRMTYERQDARVETEYEGGMLRVACPDVRRDDIALSAVGDIVEFGVYAGERVSWLVLEDAGNRLVLVSEKVIEAKPYNDTYEDTSWEKCTLRAWLNDAFARETFPEDERARILPDEAGDTVTLLSAERAALASAAVPTAHALKNGCNAWENGCCWYYLKDTGYTAKSAACVRQDGKVFYEDVDCADMGVRPVIYYRKGIK